ncbi:MAG TPA: hypothetical protein VJO35_01480 [Terriglobales bacterium]|nr:hypothetical protein [Terriglobales bacterium]
MAFAAGAARREVKRSNTGQSPYLCDIARIPTAWAFDNPPGSIDENHATFTPTGWDRMQLEFRSDQANPLKALKLVVEYVDAEGELIARVPMYAYVDPSTAHLPPNAFKPDHTWGTPLNQGESREIVGQELSVRTGRCPVRALVTFASIEYTDGSIRTYSSPDWRLGPTPAFVPVLSDAPDPPLQPPLSLLAKLRISASGDVLDVVPGAHVDTRLVVWVREIMMNKEWKFHPAILNGQPIDTELEVLFQVNSPGSTPFVEDPPLLKPVTLVRFLWNRDASSGNREPKLTMMYGIVSEGSAPPGYPF